MAVVGILAAIAVESIAQAQHRPREDAGAWKTVTKPSAICAAAAKAVATPARVTSEVGARQTLAHGAPIEVAWQAPAVNAATPVYLVGAMPDTVRFEGSYRFEPDGSLEGGPGFVALPARAQAPYRFSFGQDRARIVIPLHDVATPRQGTFRIRPYAAGPFAIDWAIVAVDPSCKAGAPGRFALRHLDRTGPLEIAPGLPQIVVQDFVTPDPLLEVAARNGAQRLSEVEVSPHGRYRLEVFPRRYRVFDRYSGAKIVERIGVKPRFSPGGRFVAASVGDAEATYPTNLEVLDLIAGKVVADISGPIVAWSNGDALLLDAARAYQAVSLFNTLVDPVRSADGKIASWPYFAPGCGTCDAWGSSNLKVDWDRLSVLRGDGGVARAMGYVSLATGEKVETSSFGDEEAHPLEARLRKVYGRPDVMLAKGWTSDAPLSLTHVGRGSSGYKDDEDSLIPSEAGRRVATSLLAPRRVALANGQILRSEDLRPIGTRRGDGREPPRIPTRRLPLDEAAVGDELAKLGLRLVAAEAVDELAIQLSGNPEPQDPLVRAWPTELRAEVLDANPSLASWFESSFPQGIIVAAWRLDVDGVRYLLLQHGEAAMTANGAHDLRFDLLALDGPAKGALRTLQGVSGLFSQLNGRDHAVARVSIVGGKRLVVAVPSSAKAEIVDMGGDFVSNVAALREANVLCGFYEAAPRRQLVQANCDGQMFVFEPARQAGPVLSGRVVDNELILYTAEGFYASTYEGAHFVHVAFPGLPGVHKFEQFARALERPDVIQGILSGVPLSVEAPDIALPPQIEASFRDGSSQQIVVKASSRVGLAKIDLFHDGRLVERRSASGHAAEVAFDAAVPGHVRTVALLAVDANGVKSQTVSLAARASVKPRANTLHVVAFGVDDYDTLPKLKGARRDAETLVAALTERARYYNEVRTTVRVDGEVTPAGTMADLQRAIDTAGPDDTILVFFAGHGGRSESGRYYMAVSSTEADRLPETAIDWERVSQLLGTAKGRVVVVLDACHAGQTGVVAVANDGAVASLAETHAPMVVLAASKGRQESEEMPGASGGVFTQTLAQLIGTRRNTADADQDGVLTIGEVYRSLRQNVDAATVGRQTPWLVRRNIVGDAPLF